jgi:hypothetical protein
MSQVDTSLPKLTISQVIKLFTNVPHKFVNDFLALYDPKDPSRFIIDLNILAKWLDVVKADLMRTLRTSYTLGDDYIQEKPKERKRVGKYGGNREITVTLTADCMKRLCMRSRSAKAETVRTYFIEIEQFLFHYNEEIVDGLMNRIKNLQQTNIKIKKPDGPGVVYVIRVGKTLKPGHTQDLLKRLPTYNTGRLEDVEVLHVYTTDYRKEVERCLKMLMSVKQYKKRRELYEVDLDIVKQLIKGCAALSMKLHYKGKPSKMDGKYYMIFDTDIPKEDPIVL